MAGRKNAARQKCSAHSSRTKEPCGRWAIKGGTVCATHGGSSPKVKEAAQLRLARLVDPSIDYLASLIKPKRAKDVDPKLRFQAVQDALDRNGLKGKTEVDIVSHQHVNMSELSEEHLKAILALKEQLATKTSDKEAL